MPGSCPLAALPDAGLWPRRAHHRGHGPATHLLQGNQVRPSNTKQSAASWVDVGMSANVSLFQNGWKESGDLPQIFRDSSRRRGRQLAHHLEPPLPARQSGQAEGPSRQTDAFAERERASTLPAATSDAMLTVSAVSFQHNTKQPPEPGTRRNIPHYPAELPKLNLVVPGPQIPTAVSTVPPFTHRGTLPVLASKKCQSRLAKVNVQTSEWDAPEPRSGLHFISLIFPPHPQDESRHAAFRGFYIPPLERKHGGLWDTSTLLFHLHP